MEYNLPVQRFAAPICTVRMLPIRRSLVALRARLSASPATGMVGLQENAFLGDFFGALGFLSLASER